MGGTRLSVASLLEQVKDELPAKTAAANGAADDAADQADDGSEKIAADLTAAGVIMADAFCDRVIDTLTKEGAFVATGGKVPSGNPQKRVSGSEHENSNWVRVTNRLTKMHGGGKVDEDAGHTRAEHVHPRRIGKKSVAKNSTF